ncbi:MAG TPA: hypothetical protein ENN73_01840 [Firmicutes bacterium]|nr:hypothetical protein [Bacillota bacterium]
MQVKGTVFKSSIEYIKTRFGEEGFQRILSNLSPEEQSVLLLRVSAALWYPFELYINLSKSILKEFGEMNPKVLREMGGYSAEKGLYGAYKIIFRLGTPTYIIKIARKAYSLYFDRGILEIHESGECMVKLKLHDITEINDLHLERILGWMEKTFEMTGGKDPFVEVFEKNYEEMYVIFKGTWTE